MPSIEYADQAPSPQPDRTLVLQVLSLPPGGTKFRFKNKSRLPNIKRVGFPTQKWHFEASVDEVEGLIEQYRNSPDFDRLIVVNHPHPPAE